MTVTTGVPARHPSLTTHSLALACPQWREEDGLVLRHCDLHCELDRPPAQILRVRRVVQDSGESHCNGPAVADGDKLAAPTPFNQRARATGAVGGNDGHPGCQRLDHDIG